jgi:hypothetical protein
MEIEHEHKKKIKKHIKTDKNKNDNENAVRREGVGRLVLTGLPLWRGWGGEAICLLSFPCF